MICCCAVLLHASHRSGVSVLSKLSYLAKAFNVFKIESFQNQQSSYLWFSFLDTGHNESSPHIVNSVDVKKRFWFFVNMDDYVSQTEQSSTCFTGRFNAVIAVVV